MKPVCRIGKSACTILLAASMPITAVAAGAAGFCADINHLVDLAGADFADIVAGSDSDTGNLPATLKLNDASDCKVSPISGASTYNCVWEFPLQAPAAYQKFEDLDRRIQACFGSLAIGEKDQAVNHPDFYDARRYQLEATRVTVSVKDKSTLEHTLVNLWIRAAVR
ncbi:hypothetical protein [Hoeflea sp. TYP-13]|uniref:hypothetical protein n=1 Tax=Hoeflea sp. TYP-13 TaxID=3230023 RepID=UPI0034C69AC3